MPAAGGGNKRPMAAQENEKLGGRLLKRRERGIRYANASQVGGPPRT